MAVASAIRLPDLGRSIWAAHPRAPKAALFVFAYLAAAGFGQWLAIIPGIGITLWPPSGVFVALLIASVPRSWPSWVALACAAELAANQLWFGNPASVALGIFAGNALEAIVGALLVRRACGGPIRLETVKEVLALVGLAGLAAPLVSATIGSAVLAFHGIQTFAKAWPLWWIGDATGVIVFAPLVLVAIHGWRARATLERARVVEAAALGLCIAAVGGFAILGHLPFAYVVMLPLLWAAVRFQMQGAVVALALIATIGTALTVSDGSRLVGDAAAPISRQVALQSFLAVSALSALVVAALSQQHRRALVTLEAANEALEQRVSERTAALRENERSLEAALRVEQRARDVYLHLIRHNPFGIYLVDADFRLAQVSRGAEKVFAHVSPLLGRDFAEILAQIWAEPFASDAIARFRHTLRTGEPYSSRSTERRADIAETEAYDWRIERVVQPDGRYGIVCYFYDMTERLRYEERIRLLMHEVNHRSKNMLTLILAIARQTAAGDPAEFVTRFEQRVRSLAASQDLLIETAWRGAGAAELAASQLAHFRDMLGTRIRIGGPRVRLKPEAAQTLGLAIHELATNASKYGALSNGAGEVRLDWDVAAADDGTRRFQVSWIERGGPPIAAAGRRGFGTVVIDKMSRLALDAEVEFSLATEGLTWRLSCAADRVLESDGGERAGVGQGG